MFSSIPTNGAIDFVALVDTFARELSLAISDFLVYQPTGPYIPLYLSSSQAASQVIAYVGAGRVINITVQDVFLSVAFPTFRDSVAANGGYVRTFDDKEFLVSYLPAQSQ